LLAVRRLRLENRVDLYLALGGGFDVVDVELADGSENEDPPDRQESSS
jgi:hypothetical protein